MASLNYSSRRIGEHRLLDRVGCPRPQHVVDDVSDLVGEEVVENAVAAHDHDVPLIGGDHVESGALLYDLDRDTVVEIGVDPAIHACQLQRRLQVPVDTLHLRLKDRRQRTVVPVQSPEHQQFAISDGDDRHHWVQLAMYPRAVIHDGKDNCQRAQGSSGLERSSQQRYGAKVGILIWQLSIRYQLVHGELLTSLEDVGRQDRGIDAEVLDLRDAVRDSQDHGCRQRHVRILMAVRRLRRVRELEGAGVEAERLVFVVRLRQVLLLAMEFRQVRPLPLRANEEGVRPRHALRRQGGHRHGRAGVRARPRH
mmetsp:Transcript_60905/g.157467  ORF Transcript_60905/g.157467 Transcript_60905/m.157467 type:complete len:310 (-) Transcript_60905:123-1052(-)